jgi:hypothetical protein
MNDNLTHFGSVVAINLTAVNMKHSNINLTVEFSKELFIQLDCQQDPRSAHYDGLGRLCCLKTTQTVKDHHKGLAAARRAGQATHDSSQHSIEHTLLVGAKSEGHAVRC